jgi:hypothetical protein
MNRRSWWVLSALSATALLTGGCVPYTAVAGKQTLSEYDVEVTTPSGWYRANRASDMFLITRDGLALQAIRVQRLAVSDALKFTKRKFGEKMPPSEVAEVELDEMRSDPNVLNLTVEENAPAMLDGRAGFRLVYTWNTKSGLRLKRIHYGFQEGKFVYRLSYQAAARYYFDRDLATFESVRQSLRMLTKRT